MSGDSDQLDDLLLQVLDAPPDERIARVSELCGADSGLVDELLSMLSSYNKASGMLDSLALDLGLPGTESTPTRTTMTDSSAMIGEIVAQYRISGHIGSGGMGSVYRAEDTKLQRDVALKFLPETLAGDASAKERFLREARAASALDHPNICTVFEIGEADGHSYIAMAYYEGQTIEQFLERGPLEVDTATRLATQIAGGLAAAHSRGIVHRDMKPANVIVTPDGNAKILDFGLAKFDTSATVTREGAILGTAAYMSPEQARGDAVDHRTDIWSFGAILYEMLAGSRPFPGGYPQAIIYGIMNTDPEPLSALRPGLPLALVQIVDRALEKDADTRYARVDDLLSDLKAVSDRRIAHSEAQRLVSDDSSSDAAASVPVVEPEDDVVHILCVDDEPELELLMQQRFRKKIRAGDWKFTFALDGQEALVKLEADPKIDLVLTDLNMPRMDGLTLLGKLAELDRPLRTMVVSAYGDMEKIRTAMNRGAFDFVTKPIEFSDLETTIDKASSDLTAFRKAARLQHQLVSVQQEMDVARRIQEAITPVSFPQNEHIEIYGFSAPAADMSGTFYDAFELPDGRIGLLMGDAGGRGVTSALLMAMGQTFVKSFMQQGVAPDACVAQLNSLLFADGLPHVGLRLVAACVDSASGELTLANAGHEHAFILRSDGSLESPDQEGSTVWEEESCSVQPVSLTLGAGDALVLLSTGLVDARNETGNAYTRERMATTLRDAPDGKPTSLIRHIVRSVQDFAGDVDPREDLTILALRRV